MLTPPLYAEELTPAQWAAATKMRLGFILVAIAVDLALLAAVPLSDALDADVIRAFAAINIPLLVVDLGLAVVMLRWRRARTRALIAGSALLEAVTIVVWIQITGSVTTYFLLVATLLLIWYRFAFGFTVGAAMTAALILLHGAAVALELAGVLRAKPLFLAPPGPEYSVPLYQSVLYGSIAFIYGLAFAATNHVVNRLRERDRALAEVRREAEQAAERAQHGRLTGQLLANEYAIGELLGRGGMGEVYVAERISDGARVALKALHGHLLADDDVLARFRREAEAAGRVPHEHIARVLEVGHDAAHHMDFIAMEHLRGEDLAAYLRRRGTPELHSEGLRLLRRIATAIDAAHAAGVVHRDIKPQNIFLVETGRAADWPQVRLLDFGMSKLLDDVEETLTRAGALIGTVAYMSPEQALGRVHEIGAASDRFAFAAVTYRVLTGRLPFACTELLEAIHEIAHVHPPPPSSLNHELHPDIDDVLTVGLAKAPGERFATASAMIDALEHAAQGTLDDRERERARALSGRLPPVDPSGATLTAGD